MPHDLFGDVSVRRATRPRFRRILTIASIALHALVITVVLVVQAFALGALPDPHRPMMFDLRVVSLTDIPLPPPPPHRSRQPATTVSPNAAPLVEPDAITRETGLEGQTRVVAPEAIIGVESGVGDVGALVGAERVPPPPPPPAPAPATPVRLHAGMQAPVKTTHVNPVYPAIAQTARIEGVVILEAIIDARGLVQSVQVLRSVTLLDQAAIDAVKQWRFTPGRLNGEAVPVIMTVTVTFRLDR
jgi:protein TonB